MVDDYNLPNYYKDFDGDEWLTLSGKLAGSSHPGYLTSNHKDDLLLYKLNKGYDVEQAGVDQELLSNLDALYFSQKIHVIYNLVAPTAYDRSADLIKQIWETRYNNDTQYITQINNVSIQIEDFYAPTQEQLHLITTDAINKMSKGENILIHCHGGMGRTGTILAAIYMKSHDEYNVNKAVLYIRKNYYESAIESAGQIKSLKLFSSTLRNNY